GGRAGRPWSVIVGLLLIDADRQAAAALPTPAKPARLERSETHDKATLARPSPRCQTWPEPDRWPSPPITKGSLISAHAITTFRADTVAQAEKEFRISVDEYLRFCTERGEEPERPYTSA